MLFRSVDARHITVKYDSGEIKDYKLTKFLRSNHGTCINQRPIVSVGERVHGWGKDEKPEGQPQDKPEDQSEHGQSKE